MMMAVRLPPPARAAQQLVERPLDQPVGDRIEPRGGLVEHHQARVLQEHPGERQQLRLAGREAAAGDQHGVQPLRLAGQPVAEAEVGEHLDDARVGDRWRRTGWRCRAPRRRTAAPPGSPGRCGRAAQARVASRMSRPSRVMRALDGIVEAEEQPRERGLAAAGAPEQAEHLARLQRQRDVAAAPARRPDRRS